MKAKNMTSSTSSSTSGGAQCIVCCETIEVFGVGPCDHRDVCATCSFRRRQLYGQRECAICKESQPRVVFTRDPHKPFAAFDLAAMAAAAARSDHTHAPDALGGVYCDGDDIAVRFAAMLAITCPRCARGAASALPNLAALKNHVRAVHGLVFCDICLRDRKVFLVEQLLFRQSELPQHMATWDGGISEAMSKIAEEQQMRLSSSGKRPKEKTDATAAAAAAMAAKRKWKPMVSRLAIGHPACKFCSEFFYGVDQLYEHLNKQHLTCHLCERTGLLWKYYRDLAELHTHYAEQHCMCKVPNCFMAFASSLDLKAHEAAEHGKSPESLLNFRVRRMGRGGEGIGDCDDDDRDFGAGRGHHGPRRNGGGAMRDPGPRLEMLRPSRSPPPPRSTTPPAAAAVAAAVPTAPPSNGPPSQPPPPQQPQLPLVPTKSMLAATPTHQVPVPVPVPVPAPAPAPVPASQPTTTPSSKAPSNPKKQPEEPTPEKLKEEANAKLVASMKELVSDEEFRLFRQYSGDFRSGQITARDYHARFFSTFGVNARTRQMFADLVALLPDKSKSMELLHLHTLEQAPAAAVVRPVPQRQKTPEATAAAAPLADFPALPSDQTHRDHFTETWAAAATDDAVSGPVRPLMPTPSYQQPKKPQDLTSQDFPALPSAPAKSKKDKKKTEPKQGHQQSAKQPKAKHGRTVLMKWG
jgi:hypothetical protein